MKTFRHPQRPKKSSLVISPEAVLNALNNGEVLDRIYIDTKLSGPDTAAIRKLANDLAIPVNFVPTAKLQTFNAGVHKGCIALKSKVQYQSVQDVISLTVENGKLPLLLILDGITDIRNIGGIARTAFCTGVDAIIIPDKGVGALQEDAILTSAGALEKIPICRVGSLLKTIDELHLNGIKVFATEMKAAVSIDKVDFTEPCAIVMGSEEKGVYPALLKSCDQAIKIPMVGDFESLNVSVATGMILYEAMKQRLQ